MATGRGKGHIPWSRLQQDQSDYILDEYLPSGVTLTQYHHIRVNNVNSLLQHWTSRQTAGEIPFRFKNGVDSSRQRKGASIGGDGPGDAENGAEEGFDETRSGQAQEGDGEFRGDGEGSPEPPVESGPSQVSDVVIQCDGQN